jgi:hypothetical protein
MAAGLQRSRRLVAQCHIAISAPAERNFKSRSAGALSTL